GPRRQARPVRQRLPVALHRPLAVEQGQARERDLRARALARLGVGRRTAGGARPAAGEPRRRSVEGRRRARRDRAVSPLRGPRPLDDAARCRRSGELARVVSSTAPAGDRARALAAVHGDNAGLPRRLRGGRHACPRRLRPVRLTALLFVAMSLGNLWSRTLVYFGIAEEDDDYFEDEESYAAEESLEQSYRERPNVRRLTPRRRTQEFDDWTESSEAEKAASARKSTRSAQQPVRLTAVQDPGAVRVHLVLPRSFNDAQQIADRFKQSIPVILNLQS